MGWLRDTRPAAPRRCRPHRTTRNSIESGRSGKNHARDTQFADRAPSPALVLDPVKFAVPQAPSMLSTRERNEPTFSPLRGCRLGSLRPRSGDAESARGSLTGQACLPALRTIWSSSAASIHQGVANASRTWATRFCSRIALLSSSTECRCLPLLQCSACSSSPLPTFQADHRHRRSSPGAPTLQPLPTQACACGAAQIDQERGARVTSAWGYSALCRQEGRPPKQLKVFGDRQPLPLPAPIGLFREARPARPPSVNSPSGHVRALGGSSNPAANRPFGRCLKHSSQVA